MWAHDQARLLKINQKHQHVDADHSSRKAGCGGRRHPHGQWSEWAWRSVGTVAHAERLGEHPETSLESLLLKASRPHGLRLPHRGDRSNTEGGGFGA